MQANPNGGLCNLFSEPLKLSSSVAQEGKSTGDGLAAIDWPSSGIRWMTRKGIHALEGTAERTFGYDRYCWRRIQPLYS
jgi:hypothetical protein